MEKKYTVVCFILGLLVFSNIYTKTNTEKYYFENIKGIKTAFEYIQRYPEGENIEEAKNSLEEYYYKMAKEDGSIKEYEKYILLYPNGKYLKDIENYYKNKDIEWTRKYINDYKWGYFYNELNNKYENYLYNSIKNSDTYEELNKYIERYPLGKYVEIVTKKIDEVFYERYKDSENIEEIEKYVKRYPASKYIDKLKKRLEKLYFNEVKGIESANIYLERYPNGRYVNQVEDLKEKMEYKKAKSEKTYNEYLERYPNGKYVKQIEDLKEEMEYKDAKSRKTYNKYLEKYPNGTYANEIRKLKEKNTFMSIKNINDANEYLENYPDGEYVSKVKKFRKEIIRKNKRREVLRYKTMNPFSISMSNMNFKENKFEFKGGNQYYEKFGNEELEINDNMNIYSLGIKGMNNFNIYMLEIGVGGAEAKDLNFDDPNVSVRYLGGKAAYYRDFIPLKNISVAFGGGIEYSKLSISDYNIGELTNYKNGSLMTGLLASIIYKPFILEYRYEISVLREDSWNSSTFSISMEY